MNGTVIRYGFVAILFSLAVYYTYTSSRLSSPRYTNPGPKLELGTPEPVTTITEQHNTTPEKCLASTHPSLYDDKRASAVIIMLARNGDSDAAARSIRELEDRFNRKYQYPYAFLSEEEFSDEFKQRVEVLSSAKMEFGVIPGEHWNQPSWIDEEKFSASRASLEAQGITYGGSITYRNQCRWHSGFFFNHPLLLKYKWYWRVEPDVHFTCDIDFDPFLFMEGENKTYGFTLTYTEKPKTIPTLWSTVREFIQANPRSVAEGNALEFMSYDGGKTYNGCHFWNNFEIASLEFYRSDLYKSFFEHLDKAGGFYYEQWGDGVVHSIATSLFLPKEKVHFFENIGYDRSPYAHCPTNIDVWKKEKCSCNRRYSSDYDKRGCLRDWERLW